MKTFSNYIDEGIKLTGTGKSLALRLGIGEKDLSAARAGKRGMKESACLELAILINIPLGKIIAAREADRATNPKEKAAWEKYLSHAASLFGATVLLSSVCPTPSETAPIQGFSHFDHYTNVYYVKLLNAILRTMRRIICLSSWDLSHAPS